MSPNTKRAWVIRSVAALAILLLVSIVYLEVASAPGGARVRTPPGADDGKARISGEVRAPAGRPERRPLVPERADSPGPRAPDHRVLSGIVLDSSGPLRRGNVTVLHPLREFHGRYRDRTAPIAEDGAFRCELPLREFPDRYVMVNVDDGRSSVFSGLVEVREGVRIQVLSTADDVTQPTGSITLVDGLVDARWYAVVSSRRPGPTVEGMLTTGSSRPYRGRRAVVKFFYMRSFYRAVDDPVVVRIVQNRPRANEQVPYRRTLGHSMFDSVAEFREALQRGLVIHAQARIVRVQPLASGPVAKLFLTVRGAPNAIYPAKRLGDGRFEVHVPAGVYEVVGVQRGWTQGIAELTIVEGRRDYRVAWRTELPGPRSLEIHAVDLQGEPVPDLRVHFCSVTEDPVPLHRRIWAQRTGPDGRVEVRGLLPVPYAFELYGKKETVVGFAHANLAQEPDGPLRVVVRSRGTVALVLQGLSSLGLDVVDAASSRVWYRKVGEESWRELRASERWAGAWVVRGLMRGEEYDFAVRGIGWGGVSRSALRSDQPLQRVEVRVGVLDHIGGRVVTSEGKPVRGAPVVVQREPSGPSAVLRAPWENATTDATGRFELELRADAAGRVLLLVGRPPGAMARQVWRGEGRDRPLVLRVAEGSGEPRRR